MKSYFLKCFVFCLPLVLVLAFPSWVFYLSRETLPFEKIIALSSSEKVLVGLAYSNLDHDYKKEMLKINEPEVMALGTSRVLAFRKEDFRPSVSFYNAGSYVHYMPDFATVFKDGGTKKLKILIVGIDPHLLDPDEVSSWGNNMLASVSVVDRWESFLSNGWKSTFREYFSGKLDLEALMLAREQSHNIGLTALLQKKGFRPDGSYDYGPDLEKERDEHLASDIDNRLKNIADDRQSFEYGSSVSDKALRELDTFLSEAEREGVYVVGFTPPYASAIKNKVESLGNDRKKIIQDEARDLNEMFRKHNDDFFDLSMPSYFGSNDDELVDAIHGSEAMYKKAILYMAHRDAKLSAYVAQ